MGLKIIEADIFQLDTKAIVHQANCFGKFGKGFAGILRSRYPEIIEADKSTKCGDQTKLGQFSCIKTLDNKYYIYNLYSQYRYGVDCRHTNYEAFYSGMTAIESHARNLDLNVVSVPYNIGCGLGGGSWQIIEVILKDIFEMSPIFLQICKNE